MLYVMNCDKYVSLINDVKVIKMRQQHHIVFSLLPVFKKTYILNSCLNMVSDRLVFSDFLSFEGW